MNKELLDKYSKISVIVIAVILVISFIGVVYSKVWVPYQERLSQERQDQKYFEASQKRQENQVLLNKCYADAQIASDKRRDESCTHKIGDGRITCINVSFENKSENCKDYFYCSAEFLKSNDETEKAERKSCESKYPLNF